MMIIDRDATLDRLIRAKSHHLMKIITGIRRCGKSFLLFRLFKDHLLESGIKAENIIEINLEQPDFHAFRNALALQELIKARTKAIRGEYFVDVGIVQTYPTKNGVQTPTPTEVDFVANNGSQRLYIQSAFAIPTEEKLAQETNSLRHLHDGFRRIVINADRHGEPTMDDLGFVHMGLKHFLLNAKAVELP